MFINKTIIFYCLRHPQILKEENICYGRLDLVPCDINLNEIAKKIPSQDLVFSSPLLRCSRISTKIAKKIIYDDRLLEMNFGEWEGCPWDEIKKDDLDEWSLNLEYFRFPQGENFFDMKARVMSFLTDYAFEQLDKKIIVTHAGVIRTLIVITKSIPLSEALKIKIEFGELVKIEYTWP